MLNSSKDDAAFNKQCKLQESFSLAAIQYEVQGPLHNVYFVKYDVTVSFFAQVLDTVTYFVSQVLDTAS